MPNALFLTILLNKNNALLLILQGEAVMELEAKTNDFDGEAMAVTRIFTHGSSRPHCLFD